MEKQYINQDPTPLGLGVGLAKPLKARSENCSHCKFKDKFSHLANPTFPKNSLEEMHTITIKQLMRLNK